MSRFRAALASYVEGQTDLPALQGNLKSDLSSEPALAPVLGALIESSYREGRINGPTYLDLIEIVRATTPPVMPPAPAPVDPHAEETRFRALDPDEEATRMRPDPAPATPALADDAATQLAPPDDRPRRTPSNVATGPGSPGSSDWGPSRATGGEDRPLRPGDVIKERFVLEDIIGKGGMGIVFRVRDLRKEEAQDRYPYAALKVLGEDFKRHPESLKALQREARKAQTLAHPNIVTVYDFDRDGPNVYMVMELLEGEPLDRYIRNLNGQGLTIAKALPIIRALCGALGYAHEHQVVHSDFKPANAFATKNGPIKVFDFGIARAAKRTDIKDDTSNLTLFDAGTLGALTPAYASCEMLEGGEPDPRDDIYALGCVVYELLACTHPFERKTAVQARDAKMKPKPIRGLTARQWRALRRSLAFDRNARTPSIAKFLEEISPQKRSAAPWIGAAVAFIVLGITASLTVPQYLQRRQTSELAAVIRSGAVEDALPRLEALPADARAGLLLNDEVRASIIEYFNEQIEMATDRDSGGYDYARAEKLIAQLQRLFPDSQSASQIAEGVTARRENEIKLQQAREQEQARIAELKRRLPAQIAANDVSAATITLRDLRASLAADDPLLVSAPQDLAAAYVRLAAQAASEGHFDTALSQIEKSLEFDRSNPQIASLRDSYAQQLAAKLAARSVAAPAKETAAPVVKPVEQPPEQAATTPTVQPKQAATAGPVCTAKLAGYGTRSRGVCFDAIGSGRGPEMVVVPAGAGFAHPFAISRFEVSAADYATYCEQSGKCRASSAQPDLPATSIAASDAQHYAQWLTATTGFTYRLPTDAEWSYVASAAASGERDFNCVVEINGQKIRGFGLESVRAGRPNAWGLYNLVGNAQEWVKTQQGWNTRGGAFSDPISQCAPTASRSSDGAADAATGFRVVREIG